MKDNKICVLIFVFFMFTGSVMLAQNSIPIFKPFPGSVHGFSEYFSFNVLNIKADGGGSYKKVAGEYWDQNFLLDTIGSYDITARDFIKEQLEEFDGKFYLQDDINMYFSFSENNNYYWGRFFSKDKKSYRILLIREKPIENRLEFNSDEPIIYDEYLAEMPVPPVIRPINGSVAVTGKFSKYNVMNILYKSMGKRFEKKAGGQYWDIKFDFKDIHGNRDASVSKFEIKENFYQEVVSNKGVIIHDMGYLLVFYIPGENFTVWCRLSILQHGVYILNIVQEMKEDFTPPVEIR